MIGQHLILRCANGVYDHANIAGLKTAAVSDNIAALASARQQELNKVISEHAAFPDVGVTSGKGENRGVLRLFEYRGVLMALRTFRVHDLCDTGGSVSFTHTYMIADDNAGEDRLYILSHPESLCSRDCFDDYKKVAERTDGGLNSGNPVRVNEELKMPDKTLPRLDTKIFDRCGIDEDTFAHIVAAVCRHVSSKGWIALMTPNITEKTWDDEGGSAEGEKLIGAFLTLLPDCITRFFSAVSYWNDNPSNDVLKDYQLRILSGKFTDGLVDSDISLFNLQSKTIHTDVAPGSFGRYLWGIKDNPEEIEKFHTFLTNAFGKRVDKIGKMPVLMDALTDLYKFTEGIEIDEQSALEAFLMSIGTNIPMFPAIYKGVAMLIFSVKESGKPCTEKLENVISSLLKNPEARKMKVCYDNLVYILMNSVKLGTVKNKTIAMIEEQLDNKEAEEFRTNFFKLIDELKADRKATASFALLSLIIDGQDIPMLQFKKEELMDIAERCYDNAVSNNDLELCARITTKQLNKDSPPDNVTDICKRVVELTDYVATETADTLVKAIGDQMDRFEQFDDTIVSMGKAIFGLRFDSEIAEHPNFFPLFMKVLRHALIADRDYAETVWVNQYISAIRNTNSEDYLYPELLIGDSSQEMYAEALYIVETARLQANVGYASSWDSIEGVMSVAIATDPEKAYSLAQEILDKNTDENRDALLMQIIGTPMIYGLFLALFGKDDDMAAYYVGYIMQDVNAFDLLLETANTQHFENKLAPAYVYVWTCVYSQFAAEMLENCWLGILDTELKVRDTQYEVDIMSQFANYFAVVFDDISMVPEIKEEYIGLMYRGIVDYGWDKALGLNEQQTDIIEMCALIDSGEGDYCIDYFIDRISEFVAAGRNITGRPENLFFCAKRINRTLNNLRRKIMGDTVAIDVDKIALMSLARMYGQHHDESHSLFYLKGICEGDDHWIASLYVLTALKYLYVIEPETSLVINDFIDRIRAVILKMSSAGRQTMLSAECQDLYHSYIQPHLYQDQQKPLFKAAQGTGNPDLMAMFEIRVTKERPKSGGIFGGFKRR